ncbi:thioredoxin family protein [uncultured Arcticibacterium sp.]|uniref:thioredoxin family protein n=1 Tax=uncultured Arcticibacterium sp. TaxID=2173042 RepID=UPI0030FC7093
MKKLTILALAISLFTLGAWTSEKDVNTVKFYSGTYDNFLRSAKKQHKPIILDFWASWCGPCKKMDRETFSNPDLAEYLNENYLVYRVNIDSEDGKAIIERFGVKEFPTLLVADYKGNEVTKLKGFYYPNYLTKTLDGLDESHRLLGSSKKEQYVMN